MAEPGTRLTPKPANRQGPRLPATARSAGAFLSERQKNLSECHWSAGWLASRFGLTSTLYAGLGIQVVALLALAALDPAWAMTASIIYVMAVQGASGIAKDLAKMSSKSAVKLLAPSTGGALFRWVALLTGSKNAIKGLGFFVGGALLATAGFTASIVAMAIILCAILVAVACFMPSGLPGGKKDVKVSAVLPKDPNILDLSLARVFLFGARDTWFVVGIPIFFYGVLSDGTPESARQAFFLIGIFMSGWIILYGAVQASAPMLLARQTGSLEQTIRSNHRWVAVLTAILAFLSLAAILDVPGLAAIIVAGLLVFGVALALNSALHSYLILALAKSERVTMDVGFYYMSNAVGRLVGTFLSGLCHQLWGVAGCLGMAAIMSALSFLAAGRLARRSSFVELRN